MKKQEAIKLISEKVGFVPYLQLFEIYNDDDDIPQKLIDMECNNNFARPTTNSIICNGTIANVLNNLPQNK